MKINVLEAGNRLPQLIRFAQAGEEVLIVDRDQAVVKLVPVASAQLSSSGEVRGLLEWLHRHPLPSHFQRDHESIEAGVVAEREAWD